MCQTKSKEVHETDNDIICYKVLMEKDGEYFATFQGYTYHVGEEYTDMNFEEIYKTENGFTIASGFYHFFAKKEDAERLAKELSKAYSRNNDIEVVAECAIPKGTRVSEGKFHIGFSHTILDNMQSICAKSFKLDKVLNKYKNGKKDLLH